jgi:hypothetical protein
MQPKKFYYTETAEDQAILSGRRGFSILRLFVVIALGIILGFILLESNQFDCVSLEQYKYTSKSVPQTKKADMERATLNFDLLDNRKQLVGSFNILHYIFSPPQAWGRLGSRLKPRQKIFLCFLVKADLSTERADSVEPTGHTPAAREVLLKTVPDLAINRAAGGLLSQGISVIDLEEEDRFAVGCH